MKKNIAKHVQYLLIAGGIAVAAIVWLSSLVVVPDSASSQSSSTITGWGWSDTIGWISFDCASAGTCGSSSYGITVNSGGQLSGYAWSDNIGWISANASDVSGCPSPPCRAQISGTVLSGWLKALAGGSSQSGGWDGYISLSGSGYGPTIGASGTFSGYAWGSDVVGWVDMQYARTSYTPCTAAYSCSDSTHIIYTDAYCAVTPVATCTSPGFCSSGSSTCIYPEPEVEPVGPNDEYSGHLVVRPPIIRRGSSAKLYWNVENVESCTVTGTNGDSWSTTTSGDDGQNSSGIEQQTIFTLSCDAYGSYTFESESVTVNVQPIFDEN